MENLRVTVVGGAFGSGKTEFAISYALYLQKCALGKVGLVDLDIVNPYFRSRDVAAELQEKGIEVISTKPGLEYADLPALSPRIYSFLQDRSIRTVFDVGGDPVGARALGRFNQYFLNEAYQFLIVINPFRPDTKNLPQAIALVSGLEQASRLQASGLVSNINLGQETSVDIWREGLKLILEVAEQLQLPFVYHMVEENFLARNSGLFKDLPVFPVKLRMLPPWMKDE